MAKAPPAKPTAPVAPVVEQTQERPNVVKVKHKVTGNVFEVSRKYYDTYSQVLDLV